MVVRLAGIEPTGFGDSKKMLHTGQPQAAMIIVTRRYSLFSNDFYSTLRDTLLPHFVPTNTKLSRIQRRKI